MKRLFSMLLAAVMILACLPMTALACGVADISVGSAKVNFSEKNDQTVEVEITFSGDEHGLTFVIADVVVDNALSVNKISGSPEYAANGNQIAWMFAPAVDDNGEWLPEVDASGDYILSAESFSVKAAITVPAGTPVGKYEVTLGDVAIGSYTFDANGDPIDYDIPSKLPVGAIEVVAEDTSDHLYGDADQNGKINFNDAIAVLRYSGNLKVKDFCVECANVDGMGRPNFQDAILILRYCGHLLDEFPAAVKK